MGKRIHWLKVREVYFFELKPFIITRCSGPGLHVLSLRAVISVGSNGSYQFNSVNEFGSKELELIYLKLKSVMELKVQIIMVAVVSRQDKISFSHKGVRLIVSYMYYIHINLRMTQMSDTFTYILLIC